MTLKVVKLSPSAGTSSEVRKNPFNDQTGLNEDYSVFFEVDMFKSATYPETMVRWFQTRIYEVKMRYITMPESERDSESRFL
ncbi:unnamed protein product [Leptosia nina]|uniref:Uncharacterized protein n=1 Tax=Leptosia nina TaxID=320188 RepID=A0AAV1K2S7_9NEOP